VENNLATGEELHCTFGQPLLQAHEQRGACPQPKDRCSPPHT